MFIAVTKVNLTFPKLCRNFSGTVQFEKVRTLFKNISLDIFWLFGCDIFKMELGVKNLNCKWHPTVRTHDGLMVVGFLFLKLQYFYNLCLFCHKMPNPTQLLFFCNTWVDIAVPVLGHLNVYLILVKHPEKCQLISQIS